MKTLLSLYSQILFQESSLQTCSSVVRTLLVSLFQTQFSKCSYLLAGACGWEDCFSRAPLGIERHTVERFVFPQRGGYDTILKLSTHAFENASSFRVAPLLCNQFSTWCCFLKLWQWHTLSGFYNCFGN